ncbi:MAG: hypothetical protein ACI9YL_001373 [Luteibaculaceae bacterium]|jgi:hypothetical protein
MKLSTIIKGPFLILALILSVSITYSQNKPFPTMEDGPSWLVEVDTLPTWQVDFVYKTAQVLGKKEVCGFEYQIVPNFSYECRMLYGYDSVMYYRNDGEQVWLRRSEDCSDPDIMMYDFNWEIGDTLSLPMYLCGNASITYYVVEKEELFFQGTNRLTLGISRDVGGQASRYLYKGIGFPDLPFYPMICVDNGFGHACSDWVYCLCSTQKGQYTYKGTYKPQFCDSLILNVQSPRLNIPGTSAYYNEGALTFKGFPKPYLSNSKWQLFNLQSGLVATGSHLSKTPLDLEAGVYLVFVKNKEGAVLLQQKMVVQ